MLWRSAGNVSESEAFEMFVHEAICICVLHPGRYMAGANISSPVVYTCGPTLTVGVIPPDIQETGQAGRQQLCPCFSQNPGLMWRAFSVPY